MLLGSIGQKAEVTDTHEAIGEHVEEKTADELFGIEGHRFQPVFVSLRAKSGLDPISISHTFPTPFLTPFLHFHFSFLTPFPFRLDPISSFPCLTPFPISTHDPISTQRLVRPTLVATGKMKLEDVQEFLDAAYENGQIQQKANSKVLMDYGPLDDVLKNRRAK